MRKQTRLWKQRDGTTIRVCDMADTHLVNTARFLFRFARAKRGLAIRLACNLQAMVSAEMASYYAEREVERAEESEVEEYLPAIYWVMRRDARRRGLKDDLALE